jgi:hypothetical protein
MSVARSEKISGRMHVLLTKNFLAEGQNLVVRNNLFDKPCARSNKDCVNSAIVSFNEGPA